MKLLRDNRKILPGLFLILFLSIIPLSHTNSASFKLSTKSHLRQVDNDQIIQATLTLADGYTGETSIVITADSIHFRSKPYKAKFDTTTSKELWKEINEIGSIDDISKIPSGKTHQDLDDTDTICSIKTRLKQSYSFTNGYGEKYDKQQKFVSLLMTELLQLLFKSIK